MLPDNSQNIITNHIEDLKEINLLPELTKPLLLKQMTKRSQDKNNHLALLLYPILCSTMENKVLFTWCKEKQLLTIILYLIVCSTVENNVLLVRGKKAISPATVIGKKQELQIFQTIPLKPLPTTMTFTLWNK